MSSGARLSDRARRVLVAIVRSAGERGSVAPDDVMLLQAAGDSQYWLYSTLVNLDRRRLIWTDAATRRVRPSAHGRRAVGGRR